MGGVDETKLTHVPGYDWKRNDLLWKPGGPIYRVVRVETETLRIKVEGEYTQFWTTIMAAVNGGYSRVKVKK